MADVVLYQFAGDAHTESGSPFCVKVHRALAYKGIAYTPRTVDPATLRRINPGVGKVPVLEVGAERIADSTAIVDWLDSHHPDPPLRPADPRQRALDRFLEDWADESLYWYAVSVRWRVDTNFRAFARGAFASLPPGLATVVPRLLRRAVLRQLVAQGLGRLPLERVWSQLDTLLDALATWLDDRPFLLGDRLHACDLAVFGPLRQLALPTLPETAARVRRHDVLVAWLSRVDEATRGTHTVPFTP